MAHNILVTGASGYLGGSLLAECKDANLPAYGTLYALVRTDTQAQAVQQYGATPLTIDLKDESAIRDAIVTNNITIVFWLIDAVRFDAQGIIIRALREVKEKRNDGLEVHFLHTTGAKLFSNLAGHTTERMISDTEEGLYDVQKQASGPFPMMMQAVDANCKVIEEGDRNGVRSYVFAPCIVYGEGTGFGNKISIQTVDVVTAAKATGRVYKIDAGDPKWPVCHISDNTALYLQILRRILQSNEDIGHGKAGYFLASSGRVAWNQLYAAMARALYKRGIVESEEVVQADSKALEGMAKALGGVKETVRINIAGECTLTAEHGKRIGWVPRYKPEHILDAADDEVELILRMTKNKAASKLG